MFKRTLQELSYKDIISFLEQKQSESIILDYKEILDMQNEEKVKKELARDVSAFANSQGGWLLVGVKDPTKENFTGIEELITGVPKIYKNQKFEEWIEQILKNLVVPRVGFQCKSIELESDSQKAIIIIHVPQSALSPHMVIYSGDNRYYRRYFLRGNSENRPAEHYEIEYLFGRKNKMQEEVKEIFVQRNWIITDRISFGKNKATENLYIPETSQQADRFFVFILCPLIIGDYIDTTESSFLKWLDPNKHRYRGELFFHNSGENALFLLEGLRITNQYYHHKPAQYYLEIHRNGYVEYGHFLHTEEEIDYELIFLKFEQFLDFIENLLKSGFYNYYGDFHILLNLCNVENTYIRPSLCERVAKIGESHIQIKLPYHYHSIYGAENIIEAFKIRLANAYGIRKLR